MGNETTTDPWECEEEFADAPFCRGDSVIECWDLSQVPQGELCPRNPCETDGTCDHTHDWLTPPDELSQTGERGLDPRGEQVEPEVSEEAATSEQVPTAPEPAQLPVTGPVTDLFLLGALGVSLLASGIATLRRT